MSQPSAAMLRGRLRDYRRQKCAEQGWDDKLYFVFKNETLEELVSRRPTSTRELLQVKGLGPKKVKEYGSELLQIINPGATPAASQPLPNPLQRAGETWTPTEIGALCLMDSQGDTVKAMAAQLGRSELAVKMKLDALGLPQRRVPPPPTPAHLPPAALPAPALPAPALHAGSKRKHEDREANGPQDAGAPAPSTPAKKR